MLTASFQWHFLFNKISRIATHTENPQIPPRCQQKRAALTGSGSRQRKHTPLSSDYLLLWRKQAASPRKGFIVFYNSPFLLCFYYISVREDALNDLSSSVIFKSDLVRLLRCLRSKNFAHTYRANRRKCERRKWNIADDDPGITLALPVSCQQIWCILWSSGDGNGEFYKRQLNWSQLGWAYNWKASISGIKWFWKLNLVLLGKAYGIVGML